MSLVDFTNPVEVTFMSAFLCTFFLLARVPNIVPSTVSSFQPSMHFCRSDIVPTSTGLVVLFKHTKTIQFRKGVFCYHYYVCPSPSLPSADVRAYVFPRTCPSSVSRLFTPHKGRSHLFCYKIAICFFVSGLASSGRYSR